MSTTSVTTNKPTINDFFDYGNNYEPVTMFSSKKQKVNGNKIYITNHYGKKIVQLIINNESNSENEQFAQIKIIPYDIKRIFDKSSLTKSFKRFKSAELTYHGSNDMQKSSKIHLKYSNKYETIVDNTHELNAKANQLIPLFSVELGELSKSKKRDSIKKKNTVFTITDNDKPIKLDFYISGKSFDMNKYFNSLSMLSMYCSLDYLDSHSNNPLIYSKIAQPIEYFTINGYTLFVRATISDNKTNPYFVFYNNAEFYDAFLNREMIYANQDGTLSEAINMKDRELDLGSSYEQTNLKSKSESDSILITQKKKV